MKTQKTLTTTLIVVLLASILALGIFIWLSVEYPEGHRSTKGSAMSAVLVSLFDANSGGIEVARPWAQLAARISGVVVILTVVGMYFVGRRRVDSVTPEA